MGKFVKAYTQGLERLRSKTLKAAAKAVVAADTSGSSSLKVQKRQMEERRQADHQRGHQEVGLPGACGPTSAQSRACSVVAATR